MRLIQYVDDKLDSDFVYFENSTNKLDKERTNNKSERKKVQRNANKQKKMELERKKGTEMKPDTSHKMH